MTSIRNPLTALVLTVLAAACDPGADTADTQPLALELTCSTACSATAMTDIQLGEDPAPVASADYDFRRADRSRAKLPSTAVPAPDERPVRVRQAPEVAAPPRIAMVSVDLEVVALDATCGARCDAVGGRFSGDLLSVEQDARCVCLLPAQAEAPLGKCDPLPLQIQWNDKTGAPLMSERTTGYHCR